MQYLEGENRFYVPDPTGGKDIAEIVFERQGDDLALITHTEVNLNYRGQGIADRLFDLVIEKMQQEGRRIVPVCSYAVKQFERKPHLKPLLAKPR